MFNKLKSLKLATRIIIVMLTIMVVSLAINYLVFVSRHEDSARQALVNKAAAFTAVADEAKNHVSRLNTKGAFDLKTLLEDLKQVQAAGKSYREAKIYDAIPVVAGWTAAQDAADRENIDFRDLLVRCPK